MKELHDERLDIPVLSVCSVMCDVQMIEVIRKESMVTALDPMRLDFILTYIKKTNNVSLCPSLTIFSPSVSLLAYPLLTPRPHLPQPHFLVLLDVCIV
jgi:hypothetical protein